MSPEAQAALSKARRSFRFSISILLLGFMAIALALVYRVMRDAPPPAVAESVAIPAGAAIVSALVADGDVKAGKDAQVVTNALTKLVSEGRLARPERGLYQAAS